jgi:fructose-1,6-bisphosphatase-3
MSSTSLLSALSHQFPTADSALAEIAGLSASLDLPMGVVHVISDIHGEDQKLRHVIHNASGALRPLVEATLSGRLSAEEQHRFLAILYYPREALARLAPQILARGPAARTERVYATLQLQCEIIRALRRTYRREHVDRLTPPEFRELFVEMLSGQRPEFPKAMLAALVAHDRDWDAIVAASRLIRSLACAELIVAGDLGDRGPRIDRVIDLLMHQPHVTLLWGNHDAIWMGAALGHDPCILTALRFSARYRRAAQLEEGYGILTTPLEKLVRECYADDPCEHFKSKGEGLRDPLTVARMQKALSIMQFKAEGRMFARHPEWELEHRRLLHRIDFKAGTVTIAGKAHPLLDRHLPTIDPDNPYEYSPHERACMDIIRDSFLNSLRLQEQMRWVVRHGGMWTRRDDVLIFHACVPVDADGTPQSLAVDGRPLTGRELMDALATVVRRAFRVDRRTHERGREIGDIGANPDADWLYYLWGGPRSPLFGKDKLATFETHFIADKDAHKEHKNPYFELIHDAEFVRRMGRLFGCEDDVLIVNGHVPVKVEKGEQPVKRGGNAVTIDGAFSEAYGDRGYTLVLKPASIELAEHSKFTSIDDVIDSGADIVPKVQTIRTYPAARRIRDIQHGHRLQRRIDDLAHLVNGYLEGEVAERA